MEIHISSSAFLLLCLLCHPWLIRKQWLLWKSHYKSVAEKHSLTNENILPVMNWGIQQSRGKDDEVRIWFIKLCTLWRKWIERAVLPLYEIRALIMCYYLGRRVFIEGFWMIECIPVIGQKVFFWNGVWFMRHDFMDWIDCLGYLYGCLRPESNSSSSSSSIHHHVFLYFNTKEQFN